MRFLIHRTRRGPIISAFLLTIGATAVTFAIGLGAWRTITREA